jgi:hypothetical protein
MTRYEVAAIAGMLLVGAWAVLHIVGILES